MHSRLTQERCTPLTLVNISMDPVSNLLLGRLEIALGLTVYRRSDLLARLDVVKVTQELIELLQ